MHRGTWLGRKGNAAIVHMISSHGADKGFNGAVFKAWRCFKNTVSGDLSTLSHYIYPNLEISFSVENEIVFLYEWLISVSH